MTVFHIEAKGSVESYLSSERVQELVDQTLRKLAEDNGATIDTVTVTEAE
jgi:hypothetical protein